MLFCSRISGLTSLTTFPGTPTTSLRGGTTVPWATTHPAPTIHPSPSTTSSCTTAFMPTNTSRPTVAPWMMRIIHGATVGRDVLVGMNAVVQDEVVLGEGCIVGAGCVVAHGTVVPPRKLVVGVPGKVVKDVSPEMREQKSMGTRWYQ